MELRKIQYFLKIVEEGSLSKAAQSLYLTQPTLSRFLEKLEDELGVALFIREKNNALTLTPAGKTYLQTARRIDAQLQKLDTQLQPYQKGDGKLTFGISGDYLLPFARECMEKVNAQYPELRVSCECDSSPQIQQMVAQGTVRIGLCAFLEKDPALAYAPCSKTEIDLVVAKDHPLAELSYRVPGQEDRRICLSQLPEDTGFAMMRGNTVLRRTVEAYLSRQRLTPDVKQTYSHHGSIARVVGTSRLVGFCPANNHSEQLAYLALDPPLYYVHGVCWQQKTSLHPAERLLVSLLKRMPTHRNLD